jgi:chemotaxis protein CheZ
MTEPINQDIASGQALSEAPHSAAAGSETVSGLSTTAPVYERLGNIVRALHDTLREVGADNVLSDAASEFPSARERLIHIASLTEKAANTVLTKVEQTRPIQDRLVRDAEKLSSQWNTGAVSVLSRDEQETLAAQTKSFLKETQAGCSTTSQALSDVMMSQDFQDLTGQLIKKVVALLERTENELLHLLIDAAPHGTIPEAKKDELLAGPGAAGSVALDQSSVDDLLAELGF